MSKYKVKLSSPLIDKKEAEACCKIVLSGWLGEGSKTTEFEKRFAKYIGTRYAVACANGTVALHLVLRALNIGPGDEVILPSFTFFSTATSVLFVNATPVFTEINPVTFNMDPQDVEKKITPKTKAIIVVHYGGQPVDIDKIGKLAKKHKLYVIEDAAEAHGAEFKGRKVGSFGKAAIFSFTTTKNITTGEGGMITTLDKVLADKVRFLKNHGQTSPYRHTLLGYNYRFTDIQSAIGIEQLRKLNKIISHKMKMAKYLSKKINNISEIIPPKTAPDRTHVFMIYSVKLSPQIEKKRDDILKALVRNGIQARVYFHPVHLQPIFKERGYKRGDLPITEAISQSIISLPFGARITKKQIDYMARCLRKAVGKVNS